MLSSLTCHNYIDVRHWIVCVLAVISEVVNPVLMYSPTYI